MSLRQLQSMCVLPALRAELEQTLAAYGVGTRFSGRPVHPRCKLWCTCRVGWVPRPDCHPDSRWERCSHRSVHST
ncbi:hypothetical protein B0H14DRAFT_2978113, partial [Mycena olivaceomarginata]